MTWVMGPSVNCPSHSGCPCGVKVLAELNLDSAHAQLVMADAAQLTEPSSLTGRRARLRACTSAFLLSPAISNGSRRSNSSEFLDWCHFSVVSHCLGLVRRELAHIFQHIWDGLGHFSLHLPGLPRTVALVFPLCL